jgi:hypothetical protein
MLAGDNAKVARTRYLDTPDTVRPMRDHRPSRRVHFADSTTLILADHSAVRCADGLRPAVGKSRDLRLPAPAGLSAALTAELLAAGLSATLTAELLAVILAAGLSTALTALLAGDLAAGLSTTLTALLAGDLAAGLSATLTALLTGDLAAGLSATLTALLAGDLSTGLSTALTALLAGVLPNWGLSWGLASGGLSGGLTSCGGLSWGLTICWGRATPAFPLVFLVLCVYGGGECEQQHNQCCPNRSAESGLTGSRVIH